MNKLAVNGGSPVRTKPYPKWPVARASEYRRLLGILKTDDWSTLNQEVNNLGEMFALYTGAKYALPVSSGTVGLEVILRALNIGRGDEVIVPIYTFVASVSSILYTGATPVFADVLYGTHLLDPASFEKNITPKTKAVLAVHIGGRPCDMDAICEIAKKHNILVIEDSAQAHGASWKGKKTGTLGIAGSFSFQASKNLSCGEGGMITTNDEALFRQMWSVREYGRDSRSDIWYEHTNLGTNAGMAPWQAVILQEQLKDVDILFAKRTESARILTEALKEFPFIELNEEDERVTGNAYHLFMFKYNKDAFYGVTREELIELLRAEGVAGCLASGYSQPITEMDIVNDETFRKVTGSDRTYQEVDIPVGKVIAYEKGMWLSQAALLEEESDLLAFPAALRKLAEHKDEVLEYVKRRRDHE